MSVDFSSVTIALLLALVAAIVLLVSLYEVKKAIRETSDKESHGKFHQWAMRHPVLVALLLSVLVYLGLCLMWLRRTN